MGIISGDWEHGTFLDILFHPWGLRPLSSYMVLSHLMAVQGLWFLLTDISVGYIGFIGIGAGAHRLWSHRSYKAKLPLRVLLMLMQSLAGNGSVIRWSRDHRLHHKYSESDADPHNIHRGFFFSHIGWLFLKQHPKSIEKLATIDFSDLHGDPVLKFQHKYFLLIETILVHVLPVWIPHCVWGTPPHTCACIHYFRFVLYYHIASMGNSAAHSWTRKPYDKNMGSSDISWLSLLMVGEGWHNFHHVFPWDYRSTDEGLYALNFSTMFIDLMTRIGWAYDLKTVPDLMVRKRAERTGDGSWQHPSTTEFYNNGKDGNHMEEEGHN